jgi:outer membrane lipoprotein SlyB
MNRKSVRNWVCLLLATCVMVLMFDISTEAAQRHRRHRNPEAGKGKAAKRIGIGAAIGGAAGGLIGGKKGAIIGAGAGAAGGTAYHVHKKRQYRRRHR